MLAKIFLLAVGCYRLVLFSLILRTFLFIICSSVSKVAAVSRQVTRFKTKIGAKATLFLINRYNGVEFFRIKLIDAKKTPEGV